MADNYDYLSSLENEFNQAEAATGGKLPNGKYTAILHEARLYPPDDKKPYPRFSTSWAVTDGPCKGRFVYMSFNFNEKGFPFFKQFCQILGIELPRLMELPKRLGEFSGKIAQLTLADDRNDPQYQRVYLDRYIGTGNVADYVKPRDAATGAAHAPGYSTGKADAQGFEAVSADDDGDIPF